MSRTRITPGKPPPARSGRRELITIERVGKRSVIARHVEGHVQLCGDSYDVEQNERDARSQLLALVNLAEKRRRQHPRLLAALTRFA